MLGGMRKLLLPLLVALLALGALAGPAQALASSAQAVSMPSHLMAAPLPRSHAATRR